MEERRGEDLRETRAAGEGWRRLAHAVPSSGPAGCRRHRRRADEGPRVVEQISRRSHVDEELETAGAGG